MVYLQGLSLGIRRLVSLCCDHDKPTIPGTQWEHAGGSDQPPL